MLSRGKSMSSVSPGMRPSVELTIQTFDPAFGIGKLLFEIVHLLLTLSFALTEMQQLVDTLYGSFKTLAALSVGVLREQAMAELLEQVLFGVTERFGVPALLVADIAHAAVRVALFLPFVRQRL